MAGIAIRVSIRRTSASTRARNALARSGLPRAVVVAALVAAVAAAGWRADDSAGIAASRAIIERTNAARADAGLPPLTVDPRLTRAAEAYAREMARDGRFDHVARGGAGVESRAEAAGYTGWEYLAENLATGAGRPDADAIVARWLESPEHRRNILAPELRDAGVACYLAAGRYWCAQEFGARIEKAPGSHITAVIDPAFRRAIVDFLTA